MNDGWVGIPTEEQPSNNYNYNFGYPLPMTFGGARQSSVPALVRVFCEKLNYFDAQMNCWKHGAHLASFNSVAMLERLKQLANGTDFWLGLYRLGEKLPSFPQYRLYFTDGSPYILNSPEEHEALWGRYYVSNGRIMPNSTPEMSAYGYDPAMAQPKEVREVGEREQVFIDLLAWLSPLLIAFPAGVSQFP